MRTKLATQIGTRLGLWPSDVELLSKVVRHHLLLHDIGLDVVSFVGLRLLLLGSFEIQRPLHFQIARGFRLFGLG